MKLAEFISMLDIKMTVGDYGDRPKSNFPAGSKRWRCKLSRPGLSYQMTVSYHMGPGFEGRKPTIEEVLGTLRDDAHLLRSGEAPEMGIDENPLKQEHERLKRFMGDYLEALLDIDDN